MSSLATREDDSSPIKSTIEWIANIGINGFGVLPSAIKVAEDHLQKSRNAEDAINSIIMWRSTYAAGAGFITGLGGITTLPVTIPAGLLISYAIGANTAAAVAYLRGYDIDSEQVRTMILLCLIGEAGEEILKTAGITIGKKICSNMIKQIPSKVLKEINKKVGFRLITKAGEKGSINLIKMVPIAGGVVGGSFDAIFVNGCGQLAKKMF